MSRPSVASRSQLHIIAPTHNYPAVPILFFNSKYCSEEERLAASQITYAGESLAFSSSFIYLGIVYTDDKPISNAIVKNLTKAKQAAQLMLRRCHSMDIGNVYIKCKLFDSLVKPILCYGCELWSPYILAKGRTFHGIDGAAEVWHRCILRQMVGVRHSVSTSILMNELGRQPICISWIKQSLNFWNKICSRSDDDIVKIAMKESLSMATSSRCGWAFNFNKLLRNIGHAPMHQMAKIGIRASVQIALENWWDKLWGKLPGFECSVRDVPDRERGGWKSFVYNRWFAQDVWRPHLSFIYHLHDFKQIKAVAQFRMGVHWLNTELPALRSTPRSQRLCKCCSSQVREDEMHVLECPFYEPIRRRYWPNLPTNTCFSDADMWNLMNADSDGPFWEKLANFLLKCKKHRANLIEIPD